LQALRQKRKPQWWWETRPNFPPQFEQRFCNLVMTLSSGFAGVSTPTNFVASCYFNSINATQRCAGDQVSTVHCRGISAELTFRNKVNLARTLRTECAPTGTRQQSITAGPELHHALDLTATRLKRLDDVDQAAAREGRCATASFLLTLHYWGASERGVP
jgi:hypothetical protein